MKNSIACLLLLVSLMTGMNLSAQRNHINFDRDWKFHPGHAADASKDFNYTISNIFSKASVAPNTAIPIRFDDSKWRKLDIPHDWVVELPFAYKKNDDLMAHGYKPVGGLFPENSIGWYRKHFNIARTDSGTRFQLQFDGVFRDANFWLNGFYLGNNKGGYIGVSFDVTDVVNFGSDNVLVVRADASQYEGWFYEGAGIYRHVWLNQYQNVHIPENGLFVYASLDGKNSSVTIQTDIINESMNAESVTVQTYITDRDGKLLASTKEQPLSLKLNGSGSFTNTLSLTNVRPWSLDDPYLYRAVSLIKQNGKIIDQVKQRFGIRKFEFTTKGFFLNGQPMKIQGVCNHQDHAGVGSALPDGLQYYRVRLLKDMGVNAYRTSHNPPTPELLEACDSLGMMVMDETRLLSSTPEYLDQFEKLVKRDRNHASVFLWSIGNEEWAVHNNSNGRRVAQTMLRKLKEWDPSRTASYAGDNGNSYYGVNEMIPVRGFNYRHQTAAAYHLAHPDQPLMGSEMGSTLTTRGVYEKDTVRCYVPDQDITFPPWATRAETWWTEAATHDYFMGGFVWTGFDYRGEPTPYEWPNINSHFGIMDICGFPKNIYYYYQSWWTDKDVLKISPHWNFPEKAAGWDKKTGDPVEVWVNSNAENVELFLNGKSLGKKDMPRNGHLNWMVNYAPGKLEAIAYKKGKKLTAKAETTGPAVEVVVTPYKTTLLADGADISVINITAIDKEGREVPDADNLIQFQLEGDAKIIGLGNGDPSSHESDKCEGGWCQRRLFYGKCQVIVQAGTKPGMIKFKASAAGLWSGGTDIQTVSVSNLEIKETGKASNRNIHVDKMLGADISFLPELEAGGMKFSDKGVQKDAIQILKDHGMNYVRLRIFNEPARDSGYSPGKGFCDLAHTLSMAKRVKEAGMKLLLDFHYSDYWADPGKQYKPAAWRGLSFSDLKNALYNYTKDVMQQLKQQGTAPDMVQVGNEINHGMVWPDGNVANMDQLAALIKAGSDAVKEVSPSTVLLIHIALGGQNDESVFFLDNMLARGVDFDVIGLSYYPKWHGTLDDLRYNINDLARRYKKDMVVVEYSSLKAEVNKIAFEVRDGKGKGSFIWEPLSTWEKVFDDKGNAVDAMMSIYDEISKEFLR